MLAGAGVGVAGIHDDDLRRAFLHALDADFHRRGANLVGREHAGDGRGRFGDDQREVALLAFVRAFAGAELFDVAKHAAGEKAFGRDDGTGDFFELRFHFQKLNYNETKEQSLFRPSLLGFLDCSNLNRINFQPHHADVDLAGRIRRMLGDVTLRDGGDEFLAQIFRHALDVRKPRRAQPRGETVRAGVSRVFRREFQTAGF